MDTTCWPYASHMVIQGRVHSTQHGPSVGVHKVDYFVKSSLSSSLMLPNTRLPHNPTLRVLSYNKYRIMEVKTLQNSAESEAGTLILQSLWKTSQGSSYIISENFIASLLKWYQNIDYSLLYSLPKKELYKLLRVEITSSIA